MPGGIAGGYDGIDSLYKVSFKYDTKIAVPAAFRDSIAIDNVIMARNWKGKEITGAGDTFMGCMLDRILEKGYQNLQKCDLEAMLQFANAAASIITTRRGALRVMPEREEIVRLISYIN